MNYYKIIATKGGISGTFFLWARSREEAISTWLSDNPTTKVIYCVRWHKKATPTEVPKPNSTPVKRRAYLKARITQMMRNAQSILEDEEALVTIEERLQLSRVICQQNRILALWNERTMQLKIEGLLD